MNYAQMSKSERREYLRYLRTRVKELEAQAKANRVLSAQNEQDLKDAVDAHKSGVAKTEGVLAQVGPLANEDEMIEVEIKDLLDAINEAEGAL